MARISEVKGSNPFPDVDFIEIDSILNEPIEILKVETFENLKGPGIHILLSYKGREFRACSHGVAICDLLGRQEVKEHLEGGETIECKFVKVASKTNTANKVLKLVDVDE